MKTFNELKIGDYIYHVMKNNMPDSYVAYRVLDIYEMYGSTVYELTWFGRHNVICNLSLNRDQVNLSEVPFPDPRHIDGDVFLTEVDIPSTGPGKYIYNNTDNLEEREYELVQENLLYKDYLLNYQNDKYELKWNKPSDLVLYKADYENTDGPYFVRHREDFYANFTRVN